MAASAPRGLSLSIGLLILAACSAPPPPPPPQPAWRSAPVATPMRAAPTPVRPSAATPSQVLCPPCRPTPAPAPAAIRAPSAPAFQCQDLTLEAVRSRVTASRRPGLLFFCAAWCGFCDRMSRQTLSRPEVAAEFATSFVAVEYDVDRSPGRELSRRYGMPGYPTIVIVDGSGNEIGRIVGFREAADLLSELAKY